MLKVKICGKCGKEFEQRIIVNGKKKGLYKRKYCLECSPYDRHNTKVLENYPKIPIKKKEKRCPLCKKIKNIDDFCGDKQRNDGKSIWCRLCLNKRTIDAQKRAKSKFLEYKGGKCEVCGYNKYIGALEFHHKNPNEKLFEISKKYTVRDCTENWEIMKIELDKCMLLCSNCHKEIHDTMAMEKYS